MYSFLEGILNVYLQFGCQPVADVESPSWITRHTKTKFISWQKTKLYLLRHTCWPRRWVGRCLKPVTGAGECELSQMLSAILQEDLLIMMLNSWWKGKHSTAMYHSCWNQEPLLSEWGFGLQGAAGNYCALLLLWGGTRSREGELCPRARLSGEAVPVSARRVHANEGDKHLTMPAYKCGI